MYIYTSICTYTLLNKVSKIARISFARAGATGAAAVKTVNKFLRLDSKWFKEEDTEYTECTDVLDAFYHFSF